MAINYDKIKSQLTRIFNNVLIIEERALKKSEFRDVTIKEMHTLDAIGDRLEPNGVTVTEIAESLMLTLSTVTISLNRLEKKGYVMRERYKGDRRVVLVTLTKKGELLYRIHRKFYQAMVKRIMAEMSDQDTAVMARGLENLSDFLEGFKNV